MNSGIFSAEEFRRRALQQAEPGQIAHWNTHADYRMNPGMTDYLSGLNLRDAAVLIPVVDDEAETRVILTQRTAAMRKHSGQIAFPGGAVDVEDGSAVIAALREAEEEIGLDRSFVEPIARLPDYSTATGFRIAPVLATVRPGFEIKPNPDEVDDVFEVPLSFLMDEANHKIESRPYAGQIRYYHAIYYKDRRIWGVTAGILRTLYERLYAW